jgi:AcrR family transcriptional regulator
MAVQHPAGQSRRALRRDARVNREKILAVAADLIAQRGLNVPPAGVGVGTFYRGYPDRTALHHALELRAYDMLIAVLDSVEESGQTGADAVETFLNEAVNIRGQLVLPLSLGAPPFVDKAAVAARARIDAALERLLAKGRSAARSLPNRYRLGHPGRVWPAATSAFLCAASGHLPIIRCRFRRSPQTTWR